MAACPRGAVHVSVSVAAPQDNPLQHSVRLTHLNFPAEADYLAKLAGHITGLAHIALSHECGPELGDGGVAQAIESVATSLAPLATPAGALRRLKLTHRGGAPLGAGVLVAAAAAAPQLTRLDLHARLDMAAMAALPHALAGLELLREVHLCATFGGMARHSVAAVQACIAGVAGLAQLRLWSCNACSSAAMTAWCRRLRQALS